jgi:hypothetical protein
MHIVIAVLAATTLLAAAASAQDYQKVLDACRAAFQVAEGAPDGTRYRCNWRALVRGAAGASLSGRYAIKQRGLTGSMTIIDGGGPAQVAISTVDKASTHTCTLTATATRGADDALIATSPTDAECTIRMVSTTRNIVSVTPSNCQSFCGVRGSFAGNWRLTTR